MSNDFELSTVPNNGDAGPFNDETSSNTRKVGFRALLRKASRNVNVFVFFLSIYALVYGSLVTYMVAMITNIERRFNIPSSKSGFVVGTTEIGYLIGVLPISHYGVKSHRPRILGACGILIAFSSFLWAMPFFIYGPQRFPDHLTSYIGNSSAEDPDLCTIASGEASSPSLTVTTAPDVPDGTADIHIVLFFLFFGGILNGIGCTPFFNIGVTFVDDHVSKVKSSAYFGLLFCVRTIAPVIGFIIGGALANVPEDVYGVPVTEDPKDPRFIGAWWLGFILLGAATAVTALPLLFFPRELDKAKDKLDEEDEAEKVAETVKPNLRNKRFSVAENLVETHRLRTKREMITSFLVAIRRMLTNPAVVTLTVGATIDYFTMVATGTFIPKYMEVHYGRTAAEANIVVGVVGALAAALGTLLGGFAMSRYPVSLMKLVLYASIVLSFLAATASSYLFIACPQLPLSGSMGGDGQWNFTSSCNSKCSCSDTDFQPVCGTDNLVYLSSCVAGCTERRDLAYSSCVCLSNGTGSADSGLCRESCDIQFIIDTVISFIISFVSNICYMPFCMASLRCVHENDKSLAMALLSFLSSLAGTGAASIYGFIIDQACLLFSMRDVNGGCVLYDRAKFRYLFNGVRIASRVPSVILFFMTYLALKRNVFMQINEVEIKKEAEKKRNKRAGRL